MDWILTYDHACYAAEKVCGAIMDFLPQPIPCLPVSEIKDDDLYSVSFVYVGKSEQYPAPKGGYRIKSCVTEWGNRQIYIVADDDVNLLYGAIDFETHFLTALRHTDSTYGEGFYFKNPFYAGFPEYDRSFTPSVRNRGLWTWGHVIYDYRRYLENMARLKLNMLIIWNDFAPANAHELVTYAHKLGIRIIWGFSWGWDTDCTKIPLDELDELKKSILETYRRDYADLGGDGIYFQSFTELNQEEINGISIAEAVTDLVNDTSAMLLREYPGLEIQFGLHATSVKNRLEIIKKVNPKVTIVWEDCGAFPYHYIPKNIDRFEETVNLTDRLLTLRDGGFGAVLKGLNSLDCSKFSHQTGHFVLGASSTAFQKKRTLEKEAIWKYVQAYWMRNASYAYRIISRFGQDDVIAALVEDGMFEEKIYYPVALYAEMLWDNQMPLEELISRTALRPDVSFA